MAESAELESDTVRCDPLSGRSPDLPGSLSVLWLGWLDLNQLMPVSETGALPLGYTPILAGAGRLEHPTYGFGDRCSTN